MATPEIRTFRESDTEPLRALFASAGQGAPPDALWGHRDSETDVYLAPYMDLAPDSLFLAFLHGTMVGYLTGCLDTSALPSERERMERAIRRHRLMLRPRCLPFFARSLLDSAGARVRRHPPVVELDDPRWPAHLHINVLPQARGTGVAAALMERWFDRLADTGTPGCYLQTLVENTRAVRFFERMGFVAHGPNPPIPGIRSQGRRLHQQTMVRTT
ncbi:GNAT family N-acetyltransferase [Haloechinothrix sp. LS1_15]|uniref:GNAT family N-acetyltransferase n=1 Tax=Haloechinothrix sp. LS1_15 TaxID=2652248 RepID=UPI002948409E|nr:GNAT family N-acetyltransferase [Haloechinothrix sp. LS1_15]MDV6013263.1 GNAT family N-acetyltransferase [Haloechinothrix sp. LS1_15]